MRSFLTGCLACPAVYNLAVKSSFIHSAFAHLRHREEGRVLEIYQAPEVISLGTVELIASHRHRLLLSTEITDVVLPLIPFEFEGA